MVFFFLATGKSIMEEYFFVFRDGLDLLGFSLVLFSWRNFKSKSQILYGILCYGAFFTMGFG